MIQLYSQGVFLDLYDLDPPKITLQFDSFETFQPISSYSQSFRVPATDNNYTFFETAFDVNGYDFDVTQRKEASILVDGAEFVTGELRLQKIFHSEEDRIDYEVLFLGNTRNFSGKLGNKKLNELDLSGLTHTQSMSSVKESWLAYPSVRNITNNPITPSLTSGFLNGNVLYPLIDFGNIYDSNELTTNTSISVGSSKHITQGDTAIVPLLNRIWADRFKPMVRAKYLIDKVFEEAGFTYTSNFLTAETNPFQRLYVSAWGNTDSIFCETLSSASRVNIVEPYFLDVAIPPQIITFNEIQYDYNNAWDEETNTYNSPLAGSNNIPIVAQVLGKKPINAVVSMYLRKNGVVIHSQTSPLGTEDLEFYYNDVLSLIPSDDVTIDINSGGAINVLILSGFFRAVPEDEVNISSLLEEDYKQIDFIKDILTMFKLVMVPDLQNQNNFIIETWDNFIGTGDILDWTEKLDRKKDVEISPLFYEQKSQVNFTTIEEKDWLNELNEKTFKENFGDLIVDANNDLLKDTKEIKLNISSTPVTEIQGASTNTGTGALVGRDNMVIPHIYQMEVGETRALRKPIKSKTRFLFYNGLKYSGRIFNGLNTNTDTSAPWYWREDDGTGGQSELFPQATPYQYTFNNSADYDPDQLSLNLNWQFENGYLRFGTLSPGYSTYDGYWKNYIALIYNKYSRRVKANFILSNEDLYGFNFNNVIFVKDTYYYVELIENIPLGEKSSVRVSLIKLLDYAPSTGGFIPPGNIWDDVSDTWNGTTNTWND